MFGHGRRSYLHSPTTWRELISAALLALAVIGIIVVLVYGFEKPKAPPVEQLVWGATLDFGVIPPRGCAQLSFDAPGARRSDLLATRWPEGLDSETELVVSMGVSARNVISVQICNLSEKSHNPKAGYFRAVRISR